MADAADLAVAATEIAIAARLARVDAAIPAGVAGECADCGETMPRLVGGRCGFCRDGRRPPLATYDRLTPAGTGREERATMANPKPSEHYQQISVPARGRVLHVIRERADERDLPLGKAAMSFVEDFIAAIDAEDDGGALDGAVAGMSDIRLSDLPIEALMGELGRRVSNASPEELAEANARAAAAEAKLAAVTAALGGAA